MKTEYINKLIEDSIFVEIYDDNAEESFFGYVICQSDIHTQIELYDDEGRFDGTLVVENEDIARIRWEGNERELIEGLIHSRAMTAALKLESTQGVLKEMHERFGHVCITLGAYGADKIYIGQIEEMNDDSLILHEYCSREQRCRSRILVRIEDISRVQAGGVYETSLIKQAGANQSEVSTPFARPSLTP